MPIRIVTDNVAEANRIAVVPLYVNAGTGTSKGGLNLGVDDFYARLADMSILHTYSQPSVTDVQRVYSLPLDEGNHRVSLHVSDKLNRHAAPQHYRPMSPVGDAAHIEVVESRLAGGTQTL